MQGGDDQSTFFPHLIGGRQQVRHHDHGRTGRVGGAHAVVRILERQAVSCPHVEPLGCFQEQVRMRLASGNVVAGHDCIEPVQDAGAAEMSFRLDPA